MSMTESDLRMKGWVHTPSGMVRKRVFHTQSEVPINQTQNVTLKEGKSVHPSKERDLHDSIIQECKNRGWICFHGSMAHRAHRTLGEPDFQIIGSNGRFWLIEAKTQAGKLSVEQQGMVKWCEMLGHKIHVVRSFEEFLAIISE
jgi:hypothetical protein